VRICVICGNKNDLSCIMNLKDATAFIMFQNNKPSPQLWLDLGCGTGLFTLALAANLPSGSKIIAVDKDKNALRKIPAIQNDVFIETIVADFESDTLDVNSVDGILMSNSLHYVKDKETLLKKLLLSMKANGIFVIVEYDREASNPWVPYPLTIHAAKALFISLGHSDFHLLNKRKSAFGRYDMYAAIVNPGKISDAVSGNVQ
jgi:ubiquinone/menaquinone biosynthesis C-methylase UbiE